MSNTEAENYERLAAAAAVKPMGFRNWIFGRKPPEIPFQTDGRDLTVALAVPDTEAWWLAVHQIINEAEGETVEAARRVTSDTNKCIAAVGAGEGIALVRQKLLVARELALKLEGR